MGACLGKDELGDKIPRNAAVDCTPLKDSKAPIVFLLGGPGAGKVTLGKALSAKHSWVYICTSDLVRAEVAAATERGELFEKIMKEGRNIPADVVVQLVEEKMMAEPEAGGFILVGFPRDKKQGTLFKKDVREPCLVLNLQASKATLEERMKARAEASERFDDTPEIIANRIKNYFKTAKGSGAPFKAVLKNVDAEKSPDEVLEAACAVIEEALKPAEGAQE